MVGPDVFELPECAKSWRNIGHESEEASETLLRLVSLGMAVNEKTRMKTTTDAMTKTLVLLCKFFLSFPAEYSIESNQGCSHSQGIKFFADLEYLFFAQAFRYVNACGVGLVYVACHSVRPVPAASTDFTVLADTTLPFQHFSVSETAIVRRVLHVLPNQCQTVLPYVTQPHGL